MENTKGRAWHQWYEQRAFEQVPDLARKWGEYGITVNAIAPGFFESKMTRHVLSENQEKIMNKNPLKRLGDPDSLKGAVMLLASRASDLLLGKSLLLMEEAPYKVVIQF